jgi:hypothetical protein
MQRLYVNDGFVPFPEHLLEFQDFSRPDLVAYLKSIRILAQKSWKSSFPQENQGKARFGQDFESELHSDL